MTTHSSGADGQTPHPAASSTPAKQLDATLSVAPGSAGMAPSADASTVAFWCGHYAVLRSHARGGLGEVFLARDTELDRVVALKRLQAVYAHQPDRQARFMHEGSITGRLEHPSIVPVYGLGRTADGQPYYAMRFIAGQSLEQAVAEFHARAWPRRSGERTLALRKLLGRFINVCEAMEYAHSQGVLHRDLKPSNIMLGPYGETLVVDWGLAKSRSVSSPPDELPGAQPAERAARPLEGSSVGETQPGQALGTPAFMSPEQAGGRLDEVGPTTDVYSLGATLYTLLAGAAPHTGSDVLSMLANVRAGEFPRPCVTNPQIPPPLEAVVLKAMALDPRQRYASCRELGQDVERWLADEPVLAREESRGERIGRYLRRRAGMWQVGAAALVAGVAVIALTTAVWVQSYSALLAKGQEAVESAYDRGLERLRERCPPNDPLVARTLIDLGVTYLRQGKPQKAEPVLREAAEIRRVAFGSDSWQAANAEHYWGDALLDLGRVQEAQAILESAYAKLEADQPADTNPKTRMRLARRRMVKLYERLRQWESASKYRDPR
jgi:serine/threonine protein kinase